MCGKESQLICYFKINATQEYQHPFVEKRNEHTSRNKGFGFLPQMSFAPDLARTGAKRGH
jgi:hypothetical protein